MDWERTLLPWTVCRVCHALRKNGILVDLARIDHRRSGRAPSRCMSVSPVAHLQYVLLSSLIKVYSLVVVSILFGKGRVSCVLSAVFAVCRIDEEE